MDMTIRVMRWTLAATLLLPLLVAAGPPASDSHEPHSFQFSEATVAQLQAEMASGRITSEQLTAAYIRRILALDQNGPGVNSIIELNPDALAAARHADTLRRQGHLLGPLHGIPILLKANIDTQDRMQTTAGSLALAGAPATRDATVAAHLRAGGAVVLGKTNLSEWANFRSNFSISGWSGIGGQTHNPYAIDRNPCGSSSGSGAATSANFAAVSLGTETDGSIVCPANANGVVGIKPTVGLTSRAGVVPIAHTQDTVGPHGRTVADAAAVLGVIQSRTFDGRDAATGTVPLGWKGRARPTDIPADYTKFIDAHGLQGARIGVTRQGVDDAPPAVVNAFDDAVAAIKAAGATVVELDGANGAGFTFPSADGEFLVLLYEFRDDVRGYFSTRTAGTAFEIPLGISFFGTAFSEPTLIKLASGFEAATHIRAQNLPEFPATLPDDHITGTTLHRPHSARKLTKQNGKRPHNM